ncbi:MAG: PEGA domain-containing protein [Candidatus Methylomirabilia bacterium]
MNRRSIAGLVLLIGAMLITLFACATAPPPGSEGPSSQLQVWTSPAGAHIIVDGQPTGFRSPTTFPLPAGAHLITLSLAGHSNVEERVRLGAGDTLRVETILTPLASGSLGVGSVPDGATVLIDGVPYDRRTPAVIAQLLVGTHTVQLRRQGFMDWSQAVVVTPNRTMRILANLSPSRDRCGTLTVQSQPPRAAIFLDGSPTGKVTPERLIDIPPGSHRVELLLEGFRPWRGQAVVREGHVENLLVSLRHLPAQEVGAARIETDPPGACVRFNGVLVRQKTPMNISGLGPGVYPLEITRPDSQPWKGELTVLPGEQALLQVELEPETRPEVQPATSPK